MHEGFDTREEWLVAAIDKLRPMFEALEYQPGEVYVSVGFPSGRSAKANTVGQCWTPQREGRRHHIFITPAFGPADTTLILACLLHELNHASVGNECGHKGAFIEVAKALGFVPKWTVCNVDEHTAAALAEIAAELGPYPHEKLEKATHKKQTTRLRLFECGCRIKVRLARDEFNATCEDCGGAFERRS